MSRSIGRSVGSSPRSVHASSRASLQRINASVVGALLLSIACVAGPPTEESPAAIAGLQARIVAILPLNLVISLPDRLKPSATLVSNALTAQIEKNGKSLEVIDPGVAATTWIESAKAIREAGGDESFETGAGVAARRLAEQFEFDALIIPSLYIQNARVRDEKAYWDLTHQKIPMIGRSKWEIESTPLTTMEAASIFVHVVDRNGELIQSRRTGIELIQHLGIKRESQQGQDKRSWVPTDDHPPIEDEDRLKAAIAHALSPFLAK